MLYNIMFPPNKLTLVRSFIDDALESLPMAIERGVTSVGEAFLLYT